MEAKILSLLERYSHASIESLIPILQDIQDEVGFLSEEAIVQVSKHLQMPTSKIYGLATFYNQFRFHPKGKYHIQLCHGTSCHVMGAVSLLEFIEKKLKIKSGQTSRDGSYSLEIVPCMGACAFSPIISVNGEFHGNLNQQKLEKILDELVND
ncbi:MAG TPA: NADH-quinone oxidoreductase subunit NuoE [Bacteroidetes bacterium]|nr:NADH-quinone oxidoreductase subunit NuoE [Bacteroidota bacterium]